MKTPYYKYHYGKWVLAGYITETEGENKIFKYRIV